MKTTPKLIALDWGSTRLRAWLLGPQGRVLDERHSDAGASRLGGGAPAFEAALLALVADWLVPGLPLLACGMVGSAHGWRDAGYVACPTALDRLPGRLVAVPLSSGALLHIVPGLIDEPAGGTPDVMRGEETQVVGLLAQLPALAEDTCVLMPGTHSKWVQVQEGRVLGFRTRMTGELYALLRQHSVLARLMPAGEDAWSSEAFDAGVLAAREGSGRDLGGQLFAVRTLGLTGRWPAEALPDYLSGLLIGHELMAGLSTAPRPLALVGEPALCQRYARALAQHGLAPCALLDNTATAGLWRLAEQAGRITS